MSSSQFMQKVMSDPSAMKRYNRILSAIPSNARALFNRNGSRYFLNSLTPASGTSGSQIIQFRILQVGRGVDGIQLALTFNNGTASTWNGNPFLAIQTCRLMSGDGNNVITQIQAGGYDFFRNYCLLYTESQIANLSVNTNISTTLAPGAGIPASSSATFLLPLKGFPWDAYNDMFNLQFKGDLILEFTMQDSTFYTETGTASTLTISNPQIYLDTVEYVPSLQAALRQNILNADYRFMCLESLVYNQTTTMTASTQYSFTLTSLFGFCPALFIAVYDMSTALGRRSPIPMTSFQILDSSGMNIIGGSVLPVSVMTAEMTEHFSESYMPRFFPEILYNFCERPDLTLGEQIPTGWYNMTGFEQLILNTPSTLATGSYLVTVSARIYTVLSTDSSANLIKNTM